ncbi:hypothetical protein HK101_001009 [Irineochytrium annulatum]|nr:hypothetical protein HK101_001009 [Irineochytrium annulatum]
MSPPTSSVLRPVKPRFLSCPRFPTLDLDIERRAPSAGSPSSIPSWCVKVHPRLPISILALLDSVNVQLHKFYDPTHMAVAAFVKLALMAGHVALEFWTPRPENYRLIMGMLWVVTIAVVGWVVWHRVRVTREVRVRTVEIEREFNTSMASLGVSVAFSDVARVFKRMTLSSTLQPTMITTQTISVTAVADLTAQAAALTTLTSDSAPVLNADGSTKRIPFTVPRPPTFDSIAAERAHRKERLALAFRIFADQGFEEGVAGHITVRDPEHPDTFWVNPFGMAFSLITTSDLLRVDHTGAVVEGSGAINAAAFAIHSAIHAAQPRVVAACHSHSMSGKSFSCLEGDVKIQPITQDSCAFYERCGVLEDFNGVVDDTSEGEMIGKALGEENHGVVLRNHGLLTVGKTVEEAVWWFVSMERCCRSQMLAESTGRKLRLISHEAAVKTRGIVGTSIAGWFNAQPMFAVAASKNKDAVSRL